jgi:hypothetical protein
VPTLRVHDLRYTASIWLAQGAHPKVVQRVLGHATAGMTMDLYGHLLEANLWAAAERIGDISGASSGLTEWKSTSPTKKQAADLRRPTSRLWESNHDLRITRAPRESPSAPPALMARLSALTALRHLNERRPSCHKSCHRGTETPLACRMSAIDALASRPAEEISDEDFKASRTLVDVLSGR